jgi:putative transposase
MIGMDETYIKIKGQWKYLYHAVDKSGANKAGINSFNKIKKTNIEIRQSKYLNNIVESDHRRIKRIIKPMMGFQSFASAKIVLFGIEMVAMLRKGQSNYMPLFVQNSVEAFYQLAK